MILLLVFVAVIATRSNGNENSGRRFLKTKGGDFYYDATSNIQNKANFIVDERIPTIGSSVSTQELIPKEPRKKKNKKEGTREVYLNGKPDLSKAGFQHSAPNSPSLTPSILPKESSRDGSSLRKKSRSHSMLMDKPKSSKFPRSKTASKCSKASKSGKGKGSSDNSCSSPLAVAITNQIPDVITWNPPGCCMYRGISAVYVTHAMPGQSASGFEIYWNEMALVIAAASSSQGSCFVMTGVDGTRSVGNVLVETNAYVSERSDVSAIMSTDPTDSADLVSELRRISNNPNLPPIGVFNAGYNNIILESIVSGQERLPYTGNLDEKEFGKRAGEVSLALLDGELATPLCFNARLGVLEFVGERCAAYYGELTSQTIEQASGVSCSAGTTANEIYQMISEQEVNAVWSHVDCCNAVADAASLWRRMGKKIVVGCMDQDTSGGKVDFVTMQPLDLQGYSASSWANLPAIKAQQPQSSDNRRYFPGLQSLINTTVYNEIIQQI
jgi:hypothetical protein